MRARIIRWAVLAVAVPVAAAGMKKVADVLEERRGPQSRLARGLRSIGETVRRRSGWCWCWCAVVPCAAVLISPSGPG